jgi:SAM-dependent methyltransferase
MRSRKELYNIFYGKYYDNLYKGISGFFFRLAHKNLEKLNSHIIDNSKFSNNQTILEIGPGRQPHYDYISNKKLINKYLFYDSEKVNINFLKKKYNKIIIKNKKLFFYLNKLNSLKIKSIDIIILSHVLEHVLEPEKFIFDLFKLLKPGGRLLITLPCDPGIIWSLGRLYNFLSFWKSRNVTKKEYYYHMSHEHINSINNLICILKYNFKNYKECFIPFRLIKSSNFNLMYNIVIIK